MKLSGFVSEFLNAASEGPRIFFAPIVGAVRAVKSEMVASGSSQVPSMKSCVRFSVMPARKRKR